MKAITFTLVISLSFIFYSNAQDVITKNIEVGYDKTTFVVFGSALDFYDVGSEDLLFEVTAKPNIIKLKGAVEGFPETNVTVITKDGEYFSLIVKYNPNPKVLNYIFTKNGSPLLLTKEAVKEEKEQESIIKDLDYLESKIAGETPLNSLSTFDYKMGLAVSGIYVYKGNIYLSLVVTNRSSIDYNLDALMFSIQQKRKKRQSTTAQDLYLQPIQTKNTPKVFLANQEYNNIIVCFESFTISNDNIFAVELLEKEGSRNLKVALQSKNILSAKVIR